MSVQHSDWPATISNAACLLLWTLDLSRQEQTNTWADCWAPSLQPHKDQHFWCAVLPLIPIPETRSWRASWLPIPPCGLLQTASFLVVLFWFFSFLTPVTQTEHQWSAAGARSVAVASTSTRATLRRRRSAGHPPLLSCTAAAGDATSSLGLAITA